MTDSMTPREVKRVLSVGQCGYDDSRIGALVREVLGAFLDRAGDGAEALKMLGEKSYALVLANRQFDRGGSGLELISRMKSDGVSIPVMLVSDYPEAQAAAMEAGAKMGFGKSALSREGTKDVLRAALAENVASGGDIRSQGSAG